MRQEIKDSIESTIELALYVLQGDYELNELDTLEAVENHLYEAIRKIEKAKQNANNEVQ
jgi:hypothetical protein